MKTAVVISDSHGNINGLNDLNGLFSESDYIIHLGDTSADGSRIRAQYPDKTILINGNCDPVKLGENERVLEIENVRIFATHGHLYSVKSTLSKLAAPAGEEEAHGPGADEAAGAGDQHRLPPGLPHSCRHLSRSRCVCGVVCSLPTGD